MDQAEKLRNIVRAQEAETTGTGARMITVTSGKGGVGKSSVSVNLVPLPVEKAASESQM